MKRSNAIRSVTLLLTLGLALPLAADQPVANHDRASGASNAAANVCRFDTAEESGRCRGEEIGGVKFLLACGDGESSMDTATAPRFTRCPFIVLGLPCSAYAAPAAAAPAAAPLTQPNAVIELSNSEDDTVAYTLDGERFDLQPRYSQKLTTRPSWVIEFDRGGNTGKVSYTLTQGKYKFVATDHGWDLNQDTDHPAAPTPSTTTPITAMAARRTLGGDHTRATALLTAIQPTTHQEPRD